MLYYLSLEIVEVDRHVRTHLTRTYFLPPTYKLLLSLLIVLLSIISILFVFFFFLLFVPSTLFLFFPLLRYYLHFTHNHFSSCFLELMTDCNLFSPIFNLFFSIFFFLILLFRFLILLLTSFFSFF